VPRRGAWKRTEGKTEAHLPRITRREACLVGGQRETQGEIEREMLEAHLPGPFSDVMKARRLLADVLR